METSDVMSSARHKVKRANRHIDELKKEQRKLPKHLYDISINHYSVAVLCEPDCDALLYTPKQSISTHFGAITGDAVNNLRESLDVWTNQALKCVGKPAKLHFPFSRHRRTLEKQKTFKDVEVRFPELASFIAREIEPCEDTNLYLWAATSLCNHNKHNDFVPIAALGSIDADRIDVGLSQIKQSSISGDANKKQKLIRAPYNQIRIKGKLKVSVNLNFPDGAIFEGRPVVETLEEMSATVCQTLDKLERFVSRFCD